MLNLGVSRWATGKWWYGGPAPGFLSSSSLLDSEVFLIREAKGFAGDSFSLCTD